jgi:hypothetical protein
MGGDTVEEYGSQIISVTLRRGPCFGTCPVYDVTLAFDGTATWNGERYVDRLGRYQGQVNVNDYGRLTRFIERVGFFGWDPEYADPNVTDLPDYFLTVVADGRSKTVRQYGVDEPADFWVIAAIVDYLAAGINWTTTAAEEACHDWTAVHVHEPPASSVLTVRGTCTFESAGYSVQLRRREPQGINPWDLLLDRVVEPPTGPVAQVITDVEVTYTEETEFEYRTVTILPNGPSILVA